MTNNLYESIYKPYLNNNMCSTFHNNQAEGMFKTRASFIKFIKYINQNKEINKQLQDNNVKHHIKKLIHLWKDYNNKEVEFFHNMKDDHYYINEVIINITDINFKKIWYDYIYQLNLPYESFNINGHSFKTVPTQWLNPYNIPIPLSVKK